MNTPAHAVMNLLCLGQRAKPQPWTPIVIGSILPDAPMFVFYFVEKVIRGLSEQEIWTQAYYQPHWQNFIDVFNSLPLMGLGLLLALWTRSRFSLLLFASMLLHGLADLPLHNDDAHRHFFPVSDWRFISPVSYWDPRHYGAIAAPLEILAVLIGCVFLWRAHPAWPGRLLLGLIGLCYLAYFGYVLVVWV